MYSVSELLGTFTRTTLARLLGATVIISLLPLPRDYVLGNADEAIFAWTPATTRRRTALPPRTQDPHTARAAPHVAQHVLPTLVAFARGARHTYEVFDWILSTVTLLLMHKVGPRFCGASSWSSMFRLRAAKRPF